MCKTNCNLCDNLVISDSVTVSGTNLAIDIPAGTYGDDCTYCIVVAQAIPSTATIYMPVVITIGGVTTTTYPLVDKCCNPVTACGIRTRRRYKVKVSTTATGGSFKLCNGNAVCCAPSNNLSSLPVASTPATASVDDETSTSKYSYN